MMRKLDLFSLAVLVLGALYTAFALSPSSYAVALRALGVADDGLILGSPRPIRSDEWAVWTPYIQIAVDNGFARFNELSIYHEDLRNFNGLPILDWAILFKPQFWGFFIVDAAHAFSFSHAFFIAAFLIGYCKLFESFSFPRGWSIAASILLFFTSYAQFWWTTTGPILALFPWLVLTALSGLRWPLKALIFGYLGTAWLLAHLYPPILITLAFAGALLVIAFRPDALRLTNLSACAVGGIAALALAYLYLGDVVRIMAGTVYPGQRVVEGGNVPWTVWVSQFFPFFASRHAESLVPGWNICEVATGGSWLLLLAVILVDHRALLRRLQDGGEAWGLRLKLGLPLLGIALMSAWMLMPIPPEVGRVLLWDKVPPNRMVFSAGLLGLVWSMAVLRAAPIRLSGWRLGAVAGIAVAAWLVSKGFPPDRPLRAMGLELFILPALGAAGYAAWRRPQHGKALVIGAAALCNVIGFGWFNPIQSSGPIFERPETPITRLLSEQQARNPEHLLVATLAPFTGSVLTGWGFRSVAHTLIQPQLAFFRERFPDMPEPAFRHVFNRYAHIVPTEVSEPVSPYLDQVHVPAQAFGGLAKPEPPQVELAADVEAPARIGGSIDEIHAGASATVRGWAFTSGPGARPILQVRAPAGVSVAEVTAQERPDLVGAFNDIRLAYAGFVIELRGLSPDALADLCVVSHDPAFGSYALARADGTSSCR